jgi:phage gp16-like protein
MDKPTAIKLVHVARRDLKMSEDEWRDLLQARFGVASSKDLSLVKLHELIEHLKKIGFKVRHPNRKSSKPGKPDAAPSRPLAGAAEKRPGEAAKIRALWLFLHHDLGLVKDPSEAALAVYVKRLTKIEALQWLDGQQCYRVIESLKKWAEREFLAKLEARAAACAPLSPDAKEALDDARASEAKVGRDKQGYRVGAYDACLAAWRAIDAMNSKNESVE